MYVSRDRCICAGASCSTKHKDDIEDSQRVRRMAMSGLRECVKDAGGGERREGDDGW